MSSPTIAQTVKNTMSKYVRLLRSLFRSDTAIALVCSDRGTFADMARLPSWRVGVRSRPDCTSGSAAYKGGRAGLGENPHRRPPVPGAPTGAGRTPAG